MMKNVQCGIALVISFLTIAASPPPRTRLGLKCTGHVIKPFVGEQDETHYVVDFAKRSILFRDPINNKLIASYLLRVEERRFAGESVSDGHTNGGLPVHHYETIYISREDGKAQVNSLSTTSFPSGPTSVEMEWEGQCGRENPEQRSRLKF